MNLLTNNAAEYKAVRTLLQTFAGFIVGLILVIWNTPGVPENVINYLRPYEMNLLLWLGLPMVIVSGLIAYIGGKIAEKQTTQSIGETTSPVVPIAESGTASEPQQ